VLLFYAAWKWSGLLVQVIIARQRMQEADPRVCEQQRIPHWLWHLFWCCVTVLSSASRSYGQVWRIIGVSRYLIQTQIQK
jgi:hypothetical protein